MRPTTLPSWIIVADSAMRTSPAHVWETLDGDYEAGDSSILQVRQHDVGDSELRELFNVGCGIDRKTALERVEDREKAAVDRVLEVSGELDDLEPGRTCDFFLDLAELGAGACKSSARRRTCVIDS